MNSYLLNLLLLDLTYRRGGREIHAEGETEALVNKKKLKKKNLYLRLVRFLYQNKQKTRHGVPPLNTQVLKIGQKMG